MPLPAPAPNPQPLAEVRTRARLSQTDLAVKIGEVQPTISRLERGQQLPTREHIAKLVRILKCKAEDLFDRPTLMAVLERHKKAS